MKKAFKIFWLVIGVIVALLFLCLILLQTSAVQTFAARKVVEALHENIKGRIEFSSIHIKPFNALVVKDLAILDPEPRTRNGEVLDTMVKARTITATFSLRGLAKSQGIQIHKLTVSNGQFMMVTDSTGSNLKRIFVSNGPKKQKDTTGQGLSLHVKSLNINNFRVRLENFKRFKEKEYGINWKDMDLLVHNLKGRKIGVEDGYVTGEVTKASFTEKSGYEVKSLTGKTKVGHGETVVEDLHLVDNHSDLYFDQYKMSFQKERPFYDFLHRVKIAAVLNEGTLDFESLAYYGKALRNRDMVLELRKLDVEGTVSDFNVNRLEFKDRKSGIEGGVEGRLSGLPKIPDFKLDLDVEDLNFTSKGIQHILQSWAPRAKASIEKFAKDETLTFNGSLSGFLDKLNIEGDITTAEQGSLNADIGFDHLAIKTNRPMTVSGRVSTNNLNLGKILNSKQLGPCTMRTQLQADLGKSMKVKIDTIFVDRLQAMKYDYSGIVGAGTYSQNAFDGRIISSDPNLNFLFQGIFTLSDKTQNGVYKFYADLGYADLEKLHLETMGIKKISCQIDANYINVGKKELLGDLDINNLVLENDKGRHEVGDICMKSHSTDNIYRMNLTSNFLNGTYVGDKPVISMVGDIMQLTVKRDLPSLLKKDYDKWNGEKYEIRLNFHDKKNLIPSLFPGYYVADSTSLKFDLASDGLVKAQLVSPRIAKGRNYLRNLDLQIDNSNGSLNGTMNSKELNISSLNFQNNNTMIYADDDHFGFGITYDNQTDVDNRGEIYLSGDLERDEKGILMIHGQTLPSNIYHDGNGWTISSSKFEIAGKDISLEKLSAVCNDQSLTIGGGISPDKRDTLKVVLQNYDISLLNNILSQDLGLKGFATGKAYLISPRKSSSGLLVNVACDSTSIGGYDMGTLHIASALDNVQNKLQFLLRNDLGGKHSIDINGDYALRSKKINASANLNGFNIGYASPFLKSVFSKFEGNLSGRLKASGTFQNLKLSSDSTRFENALLEVAFTKVPYTLNGPFHVDGEGLHFDNDIISDNYGSSGTLSGGILFSNFKDLRLDTKIRMNQLEALNTTEADNKSFSGHVFASGDVSISGPLNQIFIDVNARTAKEGSFHIPLDNASSAKNSDLLTFKEEERYEYVDPYDVMMNNLATNQKKRNDFGVRLRINVNPNTEALVEVDRAAGNVLTGRGSGNIDLSVRPSRDIFTINGDYTISQGNFHFNAMNIAQRDFALTDGSNIRFNGDIMDSRLDITGVYTTKASVATLIADTTTVSARRTVNCMIGISGRLREPSLKFEIEIPDLDPTTQGKVESALNTEDKVQRQFLSLLISNTFLPNEQSGVVNNTATLYSSVAEIMAGQLNSILNKLNIPLDLGLNYQSSESGANIFDVAVSTQLFNNRVIVNGAFGNRDYSNSGTQGSDVVGDLDIEIKLDKPGRVRLTLFSHSADDYTNYLDNTQRNGVGIAYQVEFNRFTEFVKRLFTPKRKREEVPAEAPKQEMKTIKIED